MLRRLPSLSNARDQLLVLATVMFVAVLGAVVSDYALEHEPVDPASVSADVRRGNDLGSDERFREYPVAAMSFAMTEQDRATSAPVLDPAIPVERFSGEAGGRQETVILRDPRNRRSYLLDTASLMHRRGWIDLESRVEQATAGMIDLPTQPLVKGGPW